MAFIKINKQNFYHNLNQIALKTGSVEKIAIVLKDNAYGHGLELMGRLASEFGIRHAVVRKTEEAEQIRSLFETILILGDSIIKDEKYSFTINSLEDIKKAMQEGFSTAKEEYREMGFGAGMGLPNMKKNSDQIHIESNNGQGTVVRMIFFLPEGGKTD